MSEQLQVKSEQDFSFVCPSNEFRRVVQALEPVNDPLAVQISATGMRLGAMDPSHVSMAVADLEPGFFQDWESKPSKMSFALSTALLLKIWSNDHVGPIRFKMSSDKTVVSIASSSLIKTFEIPTPTEPDDPVIDEQKYLPTTEIRVGTNAWCDAVTTVSKTSRGMRLEANSDSVVLKAFEPDLVVPGFCELRSWHGEIHDSSVVHYGTDFIVPFLEPLSKLADHISLAFGSDMPLRITAKFHHGACRFWFSPRIYDGGSISA